MKPAFAVSAIAALVSSLAVYADARPVDHKIHQLRNEIIALDASLITYISEAENSIGDDVEQLHASIVAAHRETVDTAAAYREAKSLIDDLDALRQHAIADLTLPSDYTPPNVLSTALASAATEPESVLASTYQDFLSVERLMTAIDVASLDIQRKLKRIAENQENSASIQDMFEMQLLMNHLSQVSEMSTSVISASQTAIMSMARNVKG